MKDAYLHYRTTNKVKEMLKELAESEGQTASEYINDLIKYEYKKMKDMGDNMRSKLEELKKKYFEIGDEIDVIKANGHLGKLINLRERFDETFDQFFDRKELRQKYDAWNDEEDEPNFDYSNKDLENKLNNDDLKELITFYENYIDRLEDELNELKNEE